MERVFFISNRTIVAFANFYTVIGEVVSICLASYTDRDSGVDINFDFLIPKCRIKVILLDSTNNSLLEAG